MVLMEGGREVRSFLLLRSKTSYCQPLLKTETRYLNTVAWVARVLNRLCTQGCEDSSSCMYGILTHERHAIYAGQAVVQFARNVRDGYPYAIKFYVSKSAFEAEKKLYRFAVTLRNTIT